MKSAPRDPRKRADYLAIDRKVIIEKKTLVVDPVKGPQAFVNDLCKRRGIYLAGRTDTRRIFNSLPDGRELERQMYRGMTKGFEDSLAVADKQTRDTRAIFDVPNALGIVIVLNESAQQLYPELLTYGLTELVRKTKHDGSPRYSHNDGFIVISTSHASVSEEAVGMPVHSIIAPTCRDIDLLNEFLRLFVDSWGKFTNLPVRSFD
jgi:hypothetical protein